MNNIESDNDKIVCQVSKEDFSRVTLTIKCINNARNIFLWAPGKKKKNIVKKIINDTACKYPASFIKSSNKFLFYSN